MFIIPWVVLTCVASWCWYVKGRDWGWGAVLSLFFSPLAGLLVAACLPVNQDVVNERHLKKGFLKRCRFCAEVIRSEAKVCRCCGRELARPTAAAESASGDVS